MPRGCTGEYDVLYHISISVPGICTTQPIPFASQYRASLKNTTSVFSMNRGIPTTGFVSGEKKNVDGNSLRTEADEFGYLPTGETMADVEAMVYIHQMAEKLRKEGHL